MARVHLGFKTSPQDVDWATLDATWKLAGELDVFESAWMNDHLTDLSASGGPSFESLTLSAALAHRVAGKWIGHAVLSNTFRHPAVLAKAATVMDHVTGGRFILGLGAGWHDGEHRAFGIPLPPIGERIDRLAAALELLERPVLARGRPTARRHPERPILSAGTRRQPARTADSGWSADLARWPEAAGDRARRPVRAGLAAARRECRRRDLLPRQA